MIRFATFCLTLLTAWAFSAPVATAQIPKIGADYEDATDLGFRMKVPTDWAFIPPSPSDTNMIGRYAGGDMAILRNPKNGQPFIEMDVQLLKFDRRKKADDAAESPDSSKPRFARSGPATFADYCKNLRGGWSALPKERKELVINKVPAVRSMLRCEFDKADNIVANLLAYEFKLSPDHEVVLVCVGPGDEKKWGKWESAFESMAKSFKPLEITGKLAIARSSALRDQKRAKLEDEVARSPGWKLYETPNYFIISSKNDDKQFIEEMKERLEAIRKVYEEIYSIEMINELRQLRKIRENTGEKKPAEPGEEGDETPPAEERTAADTSDPMERSRCSVVRVCKDDTQYHQYGGPGGSAGYWYFVDEELVIYDDQKSGGRANTWAVLNHEAFHQYIFYFFGQLSPHSWYNEGNGDFFSGFQLEHKKFNLKPFNWRHRLIQTNLKGGTYAPLQELVRWTQAEYYGTNKHDLDGGDNYAQGWSFIYFLRTGAKNAKDWNPAWETILDNYLRALVETDDLNAAVDRAFAGVNWEELEGAWKAYVLGLKS